MRKTNRAIRRMETARLKKARKHYWWGASDSGPLFGKWLGMAVTTPHPCSCAACCNNRRSFMVEGNGDTVQERSDNEMADLLELEYVREQCDRDN